MEYVLSFKSFANCKQQLFVQHTFSDSSFVKRNISKHYAVFALGCSLKSFAIVGFTV